VIVGEGAIVRQPTMREETNEGPFLLKRHSGNGATCEPILRIELKVRGTIHRILRAAILICASSSEHPSRLCSQASNSLRKNTIRPPNRRNGMTRRSTLLRIPFSVSPISAAPFRTSSASPFRLRGPQPWPFCLLGGVLTESLMG